MNKMEFPKITVSGTPHVRSKDSTKGIMRDVVIALLPATAFGVWAFGIRALIIILISVASAVISEYIFQKVTKQKVTITDLSAVVTGLLLALNLPSSAPWWLPVVGSVFAIVVGKQLFGGIGQNFINPALAGRAFLVASYPSVMTAWVSQGVDAVSTATPLGIIKAGGTEGLPTMVEAFLGLNMGGCIGEISALAILLGGAYLIFKGIINWKIPVIYIATVLVLTFALRGQGAMEAVYELVLGGVMLGAFFMATDYASSPITPVGQIIMGIGCGLITVLIRVYGGYPEGVSYSILIMNLLVPLIDRYTKPKIFGALPKEAKKA